MSTEYLDPTVNIDEIATFTPLPLGEYVMKLASVEGKDSKAGKPMVEARYEVLEGKHEGDDCLEWYSLVVSIDKAGKKRAGGIISIKTALANVGAPLPTGFAFPNKDAQKSAKILHKGLAGKRLRCAVIEQKDRKDANAEPRRRLMVLGLAGASSSPVGAAATGDDDDDIV